MQKTHQFLHSLLIFSVVSSKNRVHIPDIKKKKTAESHHAVFRRRTSGPYYVFIVDRLIPLWTLTNSMTPLSMPPWRWLSLTAHYCLSSYFAKQVFAVEVNMHSVLGHQMTFLPTFKQEGI